MGFQRATRGYGGLQEGTEGLEGVTGCYKRL